MLSGLSHQIIDLALHPAAKPVGDQQDHRPSQPMKQGRGQREAIWARRVEGDMTLDAAGKIRPALRQHELGLAASGHTFRQEADTPFMIDIRVAGQNVPPPACAGAQTEIHLLTITAAECHGIKHAHLI